MNICIFVEIITTYISIPPKRKRFIFQIWKLNQYAQNLNIYTIEQIKNGKYLSSMFHACVVRRGGALGQSDWGDDQIVSPNMCFIRRECN